MATSNDSVKVELNDDFFSEMFGEDNNDQSFFVDSEDGVFKVGNNTKTPKAQEEEGSGDESGQVAESSSHSAGDDESEELTLPSSLNKRMDSLESSVNKLVELYSKQIENKSSVVQEDPTDDEDDDFDFTPKAMRTLIQRELKAALTPIKETQAQQAQRDALTKDYQNAASKFGEDFTRLAPVIQELATQRLLSDPSLTTVFEDTYKIAKSFEKVFNPAKSDSTKQPEPKTKRTVPAEQLQQRVKALETQEGVSKTGGKRPVVINSVKDAFEETLSEMFGNAGTDY